MATATIYRCSECQDKFKVYDHHPKPAECPSCNASLKKFWASWEKREKDNFNEMVRTGRAPHGRGTHQNNVIYAKQVTEDILRNDYGITNMKTNLREGDTGAMKPSDSLDASTKMKFNEMNERAGAMSMGGFFGSKPDLASRAGQNAALGNVQQMKDMALAAKAQRTREGAPDPFATGVKAMNMAPSAIDMVRANPVARAKGAD